MVAEKPGQRVRGYNPQREGEDTTRERIPASGKISKEIKDLVLKLAAKGKNKEILGQVLRALESVRLGRNFLKGKQKRICLGGIERNPKMDTGMAIKKGK